MLDVCLPGTGGTVPQLDRFLASCYMRYNGVGLLIDCGEGTQLAVKRAGFSLRRISTILLTHFHADHCSGLPGLLLSMGNEGHTEPLTIAGPKGVDDVVRALTTICPELPFRIKTETMGDFDTLSRDGFDVTSFEVRHSCPCLGYDVRIRRSGLFDRAKAEANGVPMALWSRLARDAGCAELWLTHFSPALPDPTPYAEEAAAVFPGAVLAADGITKTIRFADE